MNTRLQLRFSKMPPSIPSPSDSITPAPSPGPYATLLGLTHT